MADSRTYWMLGAGAAALVLLAANGGRRPSDESADEAERDDPVAAAGFNPQRLVSNVADMGRLFQPNNRSAIMLGTGPRSITFTVLRGAAELAGIPDPDHFASDTARRVQYAGLILSAPPNRGYLTKELRQNEFRNAQGYGIDLRLGPVLWLPVIDLDVLPTGVIVPALWEEDNTPGTELPPEIREMLP